MFALQRMLGYNVSMTILYIIVIVLALWGFFLSLHINKKKKSPGPLVCPLGASCKDVIKGEFSSFLGIGLEIFGAAYYAMIALSYVYITLYGDMVSDYFIFILTGFTISAFCFSLYLTFIQAFYIKSWCSWCLTSAAITIFIFILTVINVVMSGIHFVPILAEIKTLVLIGHLFGFALGVGGATVSDVLFFKFLKDFKITKPEHQILSIMSQVVWVGVVIAVITGIGLYLPEMEALNQSSKFLLKVVAVSVIIINGAALNLLVSPRLIKMSFSDSLQVRRAHSFRKLAFALGAVSFISWYTAFILGAISSIPLSFGILLIIYITLLISGIIGSQVVEYLYCTRRSRKS